MIPAFRRAGTHTSSVTVGLACRSSCLGVDTISFVPSASSFSGCPHVPQLDFNLRNGSCLAHLAYPVGCPSATYITNTSHTSSQPKAAFNNDYVFGLSGSENLLGGHTPTGAFYVPAGDVFTTYSLLSQSRNPLMYILEAGLLKVANIQSIPANGQCSGTSTCPNFTKLYPFSQASAIPTGAASAARNSSTITLSPANADTTWTNGALWQALEIQGFEYAVTAVSGCTGGGGTTNCSTVTVTPPAIQSYDGTTTNALYNMVPNQNNSPGKFMFDGTEIFTNIQLQAMGWSAQLPSGLTSACPNPGDNILFAWGSSFYYRHSNLYLLAMCLSKIPTSSNSGTGIHDAYYLSGLSANGTASWTNATESSAIPLLTSWHGGADGPQTRCIGELSVRWISQLDRLLLTYGAYNCGGLWYRTAATPWGPWSAETQLFPNNPNSGWEENLIYGPGANNPYNFNQTSAVTLYEPGTSIIINTDPTNYAPYFQRGNAYAPYLFPGSTAADNGNGTVSVFLNISGYNPYVTWQYSASFYKLPAVRISGEVTISPGVKISQ